MKTRIRGKMRCIKYLMLLFNFLFLLSGACLIIIGGLGEMLYGELRDLTEAGFTSATAILIALGAVIAFVSFAGFWGAWRENYSTLKIFSYMLAALLILELGLGFWMYFTHFNIAGFLQEFLKNILKNYEEDKDVRDLIDKVQKKYHCCGMKSYKDWFKSDWNAEQQNSSLHFWQNNVPVSCCLPNTTQMSDCGRDLDPDRKPAARFVHTEGCVRLTEHFSRNVSLVIVMGVCALCFQVMAILFVCCLRRAIKHAYFFEDGDQIRLVRS